MDDVVPSLSYCITKIREENKQPNPRLVDYSPGDTPWDQHKADAADIQAIYASAAEFENYANRMAQCGGILRFGWVDDPETDETRLRLREARFCRIRHCPLCQWRRSLLWQARFYQALPSIMEQYPKSRWLFLTLTVRNPEIENLGETLRHMNQSWQRLIQRKPLRPVQGWIRSTEVTRGDDGNPHPHFHAMLMVPPSWFTIHYVKKDRWIELWRECLQVGYDPSVNIKPIKPKAQDLDSMRSAIKSGVAETLKYSTKPSEMKSDEEWFLELTRQCRNKRFMASGGALKNVLKPNQEDNDDLIHTDEKEDEEEDKRVKRLAFGWEDLDRHYFRKPKLDRYAE